MIPGEMIASITAGEGTITFNNEDLPLGGITHNNALYLTVTCLCKHVPLFSRQDSLVNVFPWRIVMRLGIKES